MNLAMVVLASHAPPPTLESIYPRDGENMRSIIVLTACVLLASPANAADEKSKVTVVKSKRAAVSPARSTPVVPSDARVCDYSVETDCR